MPILNRAASPKPSFDELIKTGEGTLGKDLNVVGLGWRNRNHAR
jgi:hypothetical protein